MHVYLYIADNSNIMKTDCYLKLNESFFFIYNEMLLDAMHSEYNLFITDMLQDTRYKIHDTKLYLNSVW